MMRVSMRRVGWGLGFAIVFVASCMSSDKPPTAGGGSDDNGVIAGSGPFGLELLAGSLGGPGNADGTGGAAAFSLPLGVAADAAGNVYVADTRNNTIRRLTAAGVVTTFAGVASEPGASDGTGAAALLSNPDGVATDTAGNVYVADTFNSTIRKITPAGAVTTLAGSPGSAGASDGTGRGAQFSLPEGVAVDAAGNVYVADTGNATIRKITADGVVTTLAGSAYLTGSSDGTGSAARFDHPTGVAVDTADNVYVAEEFNGTIRKITAAGVVTTFAGDALAGGNVDGVGAAAHFSFPAGVAFDPAGNLYVADAFNNTIRKIAPSAAVTTIAGTASQAGETDGPATTARFDGPTGVAVDAAGHVFVTDAAATVRRIGSSGVTTFAGSGVFGSADGNGSDAEFEAPAGAAVDSNGNVYVADEGNDTIRKITAKAAVTTLAGTPHLRGGNDGNGSAARFNTPAGVAVDSAGNVYIADMANFVIRKVSPTGTVTTIAGTVGVRGSLDGMGPAAQFEVPTDLAVDDAGNVYVADFGANTIRKITPEHVVTTLAGSPDSTGSADGVGAAARFNRPTGVAVDPAGNAYVTDTNNATIRKITPAGVVTTIAGTPGVAGLVLGPSPRLAVPQYLTVSGDSLVITDNRAVLLLRHGAQ